LIEVLAVLALAGVILVASVPSLQLWRVRSRMSGDMQQVTGAVMTARMLALRRGIPTVVELSPGSTPALEYGPDEDGDETIDTGDVAGSVQLSSLIQLQVGSCYTLGSTSGKGLVFTPDGRVLASPSGGAVNGCEIQLRDPSGNRVLLMVHAGTGTVHRQMWDGSGWSDTFNNWKR
jgi:Tfp pilus assembly protein FimT